MDETIKVDKKQISLVFEDKQGLHEFLTVEMEFFLPSLPIVNIEWLRNIWSGRQKVRRLKPLIFIATI